MQVAWNKTFAYSALLLTALILAVYYPVFFAGFNWDDANVLEATQLHGGFPGLAAIWLDPGHTICGDYWPINYTSHWIEYALWGMNPVGYHATNLLLHLINTLILLHILRRIPMRGALLASLLFATHPIQISSVAWVVERKDLLTTLFAFLAFFAWLRFEERPSIPRYTATLLLFIAAMLSKSMSITWPIAILLYHWWRTGQINRRILLLLLPFFLVGFPLAFIGKIFVATPLPYIHLDFLQKIILVGKNLAFYVGKLFWPLEHIPVHSHWKLDAQRWTEYLYPAVALAVPLFAWLFRKRLGRGLFAAIAFYIITLSPILGLVYVSIFDSTFVQDHYQYCASIGPFLLLAYLFDRCFSQLFRTSPQKSLLAHVALTALLIIPLAIIAHEHVQLYHDRETLFRENVQKYPASHVAAANFAFGLNGNGKPAAALFVIDKALTFCPDRFELWEKKAESLILLNDIPGARKAYEKALNLAPNDLYLITEWAWTFFYTPPFDTQTPLPVLEQAFISRPDSSPLESTLATALILTGRQAEAREHFEHAFRTGPVGLAPLASYFYGKLLLENGDTSNAMRYLQYYQQTVGQNKIPQDYQETIRQAEAANKHLNETK